jgi:hypothetical protein
MSEYAQGADPFPKGDIFLCCDAARQLPACAKGLRAGFVFSGLI